MKVFTFSKFLGTVSDTSFKGDQAEIVFTLEGEPPFTFTYQRAELHKKGGKAGRVLETHTASRVMTKEHSVFSAQEGVYLALFFQWTIIKRVPAGTWTVTSIADKHCRYPAVQPLA